MKKHLTNYRSASATLAVATIAVVSACGGSDAAIDDAEVAVGEATSEEAVTTPVVTEQPFAPDIESATTTAVDDNVAPDTAPATESVTEADPDDGEAPPAALTAQGQMIANCSFGNGGPSPESGRIRAGQDCEVVDDGSLPIDPVQNLFIEFVESEAPSGYGDPIIGFDEISHVYGGYVYLGSRGRFVSALPGVGDYTGETIHIVGYSPGDGEVTFDWYADDGPQPFGATGDFEGIVEVGIQCVPGELPADAASDVTSIETCTYTSEDPTIVLAPTTDEVTLIDVGAAGEATGSISYYTARTDTGVVRGGLVDADGIRRWAGVVEGLGEIGGAVHEVGWAETDENGVTTGVMTLSFGLVTS